MLRSSFPPLLLATFVSTVHCLTCLKFSGDGEYQFFDGEELLANEEFNCMRGTHEAKPTLQVTAPVVLENPLICEARLNKKAHTKNFFEKVEVPTGIRCKYECREHPNEYSCQSKPFNGQCPCKEKGTSVVVKPVSSELGPTSILGQSDVIDEQGEMTCEGKAEGFQFPDPVPCVGIRAEVTKKRVRFKKDNPRECVFETSRRPETRYTETNPDDLNMQGCQYVCKMAGPRCTDSLGGNTCQCRSPGLAKLLVPLSEDSLNARVRQKNCVEGECGPCGECRDGLCKLKKDAHLGNFCPCGEICPMVDSRRNHLGGKLMCEPNFRLDCMARPEWKSVDGGVYHPGTKYPDYCSPGPEQDLGDSCGCAPGYVEKPGNPGLSNFICRKRQ